MYAENVYGFFLFYFSMDVCGVLLYVIVICFQKVYSLPN